MLTKGKGFSLVEMLIALLLGALLMVTVISLYAAGIATGAKNLKYARLRADLQSIMSVIETDIRRAGYGGSEFRVGSGTDKMVDTLSSGDSNCIVYYYNHNDASSIDSANKMGFRFDAADHEIQFGSGVDPLALNCYGSGSWKALTDNEFIRITSLTFSESIVSKSSATQRSVKVDIAGELVADASIEYAISTKVQVRNLEFN